MNNDETLNETLKSIDGLINCVQGLQKTVDAILKRGDGSGRRLMSTCETCKYYYSSCHECRRYAPNDMGETGHGKGSIWPSVCKSDWCGEHAAINCEHEWKKFSSYSYICVNCKARLHTNTPTGL